MVYPAAFAAYRQFTLFKQIPAAEPGGKIKKIPISPVTLQPFEAGADWQQHPDMHCVDGPTASALAQMCGPDYGVGFLFTPADPFFFVDIDACVVDGDWSPKAKELLSCFAGCAVEVSLSGEGLHIFGTGTWPADRRKKSTCGGFDVYTEGRFVALTGLHAMGDAATVARQDMIDYIVGTYLARESAEGLGWTTEPVEGYHHLADDELIAKALRSGGAAAVFGGRATFADLWECHERVLGKAYPHDQGHEPFDRSAADAALAQHLAFWTGRNCERIRELMYRSDLKRDKWDDREDYLVRTIEGAVARQKDVYRGPDKRREQQLAENIRIGEGDDESVLPVIMNLEAMVKSLVYIGEHHAVAHIGTGRVRKTAAAKDEYAASKHSYVDPETRQEKHTSAFKAWLSSDTRLTVDEVTWRPNAGPICRPAEGYGSAFNTWRGLAALPCPDDWSQRVQPWIDHVGWLCGDPGLAHRFMQWLAHIVQRPEQLPHTCYLHVTPTTGIGRNWMGSVLCRVLRGNVAAGVDLGKVLDGKFNGRLSQKLLAIVDEVREGGNAATQHARAEKFKSIINEEHRDIDRKYGVQSVEVNCCRWLMFSQHLDALPFDNGDRRVIVINNPTVRRSPGYYQELYGRLSDQLFIGSVRKYLAELDIAEFNPSAPAPMTDAKKQALEVMASDVDFAVAEFVERWNSPVATREHIKEYVGGNISEAHLHHVLMRQGIVTLGRRVRLDTGVRTRLVVVKGDREKVERMSHADVLSLMSAAEVELKFGGQ